MVMSDAVWPVFEDGRKHSLCNEGALVLRAHQHLDAIATAAGRMPLSAFDEHADVPDDVFALPEGHPSDPAGCRHAQDAVQLHNCVITALPLVSADPSNAARLAPGLAV